MWVEAAFAVLAAGSLMFAMARRAKTSKAHALEQCVRASLLRMIGRKPGARVTSLCRAAGLALGTVKYHLRVLEELGHVWAVREEQSSRFFPAAVGAHEAAGISLLRRQRIGELVETIRLDPGRSQIELADRLAMQRKTFREYADRLVQEGLVDERRDGSRRRYYPTNRLRELMEIICDDLSEEFDPDEARRLK